MNLYKNREIQKICRTCIRAIDGNQEPSTLSNEFDDWKSIAKFTELVILQLDIKLNDGLPQQICPNCSSVLDKFSLFYQEAKKSQIILRKLFNPGADRKSINLYTGELNPLSDESVKIEPMKLGNSDIGQLLDSLISGTEDMGTCEQLNSNEPDLVDRKSEDTTNENQFPVEHKEEILIIEKIEKKRKIDRSKYNDCKLCQLSFKSAHYRLLHNLQFHHDGTMHQCNECNQSFMTVKLLNNHKKQRHPTTTFVCRHCNAIFRNEANYKFHLKRHDPNKKFKCQFCDKSFVSRLALTNHENVHTGDKPYLCDLCGKEFKQGGNLAQHLQSHKSEATYAYDIDGKVIEKMGRKLYQCDYCGKNFVHKAGMALHIRKHMGGEPYKCDLCDHRYVQLKELKDHRQHIHGCTAPAIPSYQCSICGKGFRIPSALSSHLKKHTEQRNYVCQQCGASFKRPTHLRIHIDGVHLDVRPYPCTICSKSFTQMGALNQHMTVHSDEKPFECTHCGNRFRLKSSLRTHFRLHSGEKPFSCDMCSKEFVSSAALAQHITNNHTLANNFVNKDERC